jgi:hypothetical protein
VLLGALFQERVSNFTIHMLLLQNTPIIFHFFFLLLSSSERGREGSDFDEDVRDLTVCDILRKPIRLSSQVALDIKT